MVPTYVFGPFRLEAEILFRGSEPVAVGQRAIALLRALVERPGVPVAKDTLIEAAWGSLSVEESNLAVQIAALRRAFADEAGGKRWIETLPRRGYRFTGAVTVASDSTVAAAPNASAATTADTPTLPDRPSIAVLPFQNMSGDAEQEYFADGMVEEIITALSRFRSLFVIARNSSFAYKGRSVDVKLVGRELGVRYVLEGSVRKSASKVRITAQLIDAQSGAHLWAENFDGTLDDVFDLQDRVAGRVAGEIAPRLNQAQLERARRKPTESLDAYDCYLRAAANYWPMQREECDEVLRLTHRAIELDPGFAAAYAIGAWCYVRRRHANGPASR